MKLRLKRSINVAIDLINNAKNKSKILYDRDKSNTHFNIGDLVLVKLETRKKNQAPYHGPYEIIRINNVNSVILINGKEKEYHNNILKLYKKKN